MPSTNQISQAGSKFHAQAQLRIHSLAAKVANYVSLNKLKLYIDFEIGILQFS